MASNKELMADITTLCNERGVAVPDGLDQFKNQKLVDLLDGLRREPSAVPGNLPGPVIETALRPLVAPTPPPEGSDPAGEGGDAGGDNGASGASMSPVAPVASTPAPSPAPRPAEPTGAPGYYVAEGKTVSPGTGRDTLGAFEQVYARDFGDGQASLDRLLSDGYIFKR